ncbi:hypothetical protein HNO89_002696 [Sporosarcina luteola]|nr:hypothetical protein [Sporosarcina luteola]
MRKIFMALGFILPFTTTLPHTSGVHAESPAYTKWGRLAVKETQSKYPRANIIDYLHIGAETKDDLTIEKFKLWLKEDNREFGVFVTIIYSTKSQTVKNIAFQETEQ